MHHGRDAATCVNIICEFLLRNHFTQVTDIKSTKKMLESKTGVSLTYVKWLTRSLSTYLLCN